MNLSSAFLAERHELLKFRMYSLIDAKNSDVLTIRAALQAFCEALEAHLALDVHLGYRLLMRERDVSRRIAVVEMLEEQGRFSIHFDTFARRWRRAEDDALRGDAFNDDVESIVALLMHRIKTEQRVVALVGDVA